MITQNLAKKIADLAVFRKIFDCFFVNRLQMVWNVKNTKPAFQGPYGLTKFRSLDSVTTKHQTEFHPIRSIIHTMKIYLN